MNIITDRMPPEIHNEWIGIDLEILNMNDRQLHRPNSGQFALASICIGEDVYMINDEKKLPAVLNNVEDNWWIMQNAKFDITQLRRWASVPPRNRIWDTMIIEQILFGGYYDSFGLDSLVRRHLFEHMEKGLQKSFSGNEVSSEQVAYSALDAYVLPKIVNSQKKYLTENSWNIWMNIDRPAMWAFLDFRGFAIDDKGWLELAKKNRQKQEMLDKILPVNPRSPKQVKEYLIKHGFKRLKNTGAETLEKALEQYPDADGADVCRMILESRGYSKNASTYGEKFIDEYLEYDDGVPVIVCNFWVDGAECLPKGELVLTNRGYLPIEKVKIGDKVITHKGRTRKVLSSESKGTDKVYKVTLSNGLSLRTNGKHLYRTAGKTWVKANQLKENTLIAIHSPPEQWKLITGWEDYEISSWGRVRNIKTNNILSLQKKDKWEHLKITLVRNGARKRGKDRKDFAVHRLVATAFVPGRNEINKEVRHLNGIAWDNTIWNLKWGTRQDNIQDAIEHGSMSHQNSSQCKLTIEDVELIRNTPHQRGSDSILAEKLSISREHVRDIRLNKKWPKGYMKDKKKEVQFKYAMVLRVEEENFEQIYGLSVEEDHSHVTGGIVTHNTGRTASDHPNMQNIPVRNTKEYREKFIPRPDHKLLIADYSAQEVYIMAFESGDKALMDICNSGKDIYVMTAKTMYNVDIDKSDPMRASMKSVVLGSNYGMSPAGLARKENISVAEAEEIMNTRKKAFPKLTSYMDAQARIRDKVITRAGRTVWLNPYNSQVSRNALNGPIQGGAADCMKQFLGNIHQKWSDVSPTKFGAVGYVHDEIVLDVPIEWINDVKPFVEKEMVDTANNMFPGMNFKAECHVANNWSEK